MFDFGISTTITRDNDIFAGIEVIKESSFKFVEIRCRKGHFNYEDKKEIKELRKTLKKNNLSASSLHPPIWANIASDEEWLRMKSVREVEKVIIVARRLKAPIVILHPGKRGGSFKKVFQSLEEIVEFANEWETQIILENTFPDDFGSEINELQVIAEKFDLPVCLDTSHSNAREDRLEQFLEIFESRIKHLHISDSRMEGPDDHLLPYEGKIKWEVILRFLHTHEGIAVFELAPPERPEILIDKLEKIRIDWENRKVSP